METSDVAIEILKEIRDAVRRTNVRLDETNVHLARVEVRVETGLADVSRRIEESGIRTSKAIADVADTVRETTSFLRDQHDLRPRVEKCERDIAELQRKAREV
jgi:predicted neutral ceramidase superfamily lipid hydrolase